MSQPVIPDLYWRIADLKQAAYPRSGEVREMSDVMQDLADDMERQRAGEITPRRAFYDSLSNLTDAQLQRLHQLVIFGRDCSVSDKEAPEDWMRSYVSPMGDRKELEVYVSQKRIKTELTRAENLIRLHSTTGSYREEFEPDDEIDQD